MTSFKKSYDIPFHYVDAAGIVFFAHVFTLAHQVFEAFVVEGLQQPWQNWFHHPDWVVPIKQTTATYHHPLQIGFPCSIHLKIAEVRTSSFSVHYEFFQRERLCCIAHTLHVFCQRSNWQKQLIPSEFLSFLHSYMY